VPVLDKFTLTEKLVPLLSRIKTKEPGVMIATLAVHEQIGLKCDIQAIATLVLPQLWAMSITPLLSADQFRRFMTVIKQLSNRVEEEHSKHLAEIKRLEETSGTGHVRRGTLEANGQPREVDFEALVRGGSGQGSQRSFTPDPFGTTDDFAKVRYVL
jgi:SCY1-like protein 2